MYKHFLITRFNLKKTGWVLTKNDEALLTEEWMEHRMWLFENFCFSSVKSQSNKNFEWLIFLDDSTSEKFRKQIETLVQKEPNIKIFYIDGMDEFYPSIKNHIVEFCENHSHIITSRIDNDDCIHVDYISTIQKQFESQDFLAIDVLKGYSLQISPFTMLGKKEHIYNPFISLIERNEKPKTVWFSDHALWKKENRMKEIKNKRLWMSIIHERNKINKFDGYGDVSWAKISENFKVSPAINKKIKNELVPNSKWLMLSFKNKLYVNYVLASKLLKKNLGFYKLK